MPYVRIRTALQSRRARLVARAMGACAAAQTAEQAADTAVWLATLPENGPTGGLFRDREAIEW
jgi:hypothetical protein